jgi:hypothetical protein
MLVKELKEELNNFPDDAEIYSVILNKLMLEYKPITNNILLYLKEGNKLFFTIHNLSIKDK